MNSTDVMAVLDRIAATSGRIEKEQILADAIGDTMMQDVMKLAYDPFITFGLTPPKLKSVKPIEGHRAGFDLSATLWADFYRLSKREITGNEAKARVEHWLKVLDDPARELLWRILSKDLRCGITGKAVNKLIPGTVPSFDVMLAHKFEPKRIKNWPVAVEPKIDGVRLICIVKDGRARFFSRSGKPFPAIEHLAADVERMVANATIAEAPIPKMGPLFSKLLGSGTHRIVLDGEVVSGSFNKTVGDVRRKDEAATDARYIIFDALPYDLFMGDRPSVPMAYTWRRHFLEWLVSKAENDNLRKLPRYLAHTTEEVQKLYTAFRDKGLEGAIVKPIEGHYSKRRSYDWLKIKNEETEDLRVTGAFEGTGKYEGQLGGLIVDRAGVEVRVGGGFSDAQRVEFWKAFKDDEIRHCFPEPGENALLGRLIEVEYHEVTPDGSLRHPRFIRFRDDKDMEKAA